MTRPSPHRAFIAGLVCAACVAIGTVPAFGQSIGELESKIGDAEEQAGELSAGIEAKTAALADAQAQAIAAAEREAELSATLAAGEEREADLAGQVAEAQVALAAARERLQRALDALADRLVAMYKGDDPDATTLLLDAEGFDDLATRTEYLKAIEEADSALAARVRALRAEVATRLEAVETARAEQAAFNDEVAAARDEIGAARAAAEAAAAELEAARAAQTEALAGLNSQVDGWAAEVQEIREAQQAAAAEASASSGGGGGAAGASGDYVIPEAIVMCESGGNYGAVNPSSGAGGAYQILPSTWELYGGEGKPQDASPGEQDEIASQIWADSGGSAWVCAG